MTNIPRRAVFAAIPAFAISTGAINAQPDEDSEVFRTYRAYKAHRDAWNNRTDTYSDEVGQQLLERDMELELHFMATPASTIPGLALKFRNIQYLEHYPDETTDYMNAIWGGLATDFDRLVGRAP